MLPKISRMFITFGSIDHQRSTLKMRGASRRKTKRIPLVENIVGDDGDPPLVNVQIDQVQKLFGRSPLKLSLLRESSWLFVMGMRQAREKLIAQDMKGAMNAVNIWETVHEVVTLTRDELKTNKPCGKTPIVLKIMIN